MMTFILGIFLLAVCAILGRHLLSLCGMNKLSFMGTSLVIGYGVLGLILLLSFKCFGNIISGALIFTILFGAILSHKYYLSRLDSVFNGKAQNITYILSKPICRLDSIWSRIIETLIVLVIVSWVVAIGLTYFPLSGWLSADPQYQIPDIGDLPKHLFAELALYLANGWPPPNPFYLNEIFAYNYLFYLPPVLIAKLVGDPLTTFQNFPLVVIAIAISLPMTVLDIVRSISQSKITHLSSVLLATWVGGLTPLWVNGKPGIGFFSLFRKVTYKFCLGR
jgi:hypothetical protein